MFQSMIIAILLSSLVLYVKGDDHPVVTLPLGSVKGANLISRNGKSYSAFMGLPYARKPEKFELSEPIDKWEGIKDATQFGSICPQFDFVKQQFVGDEQCLFVNVFTPNVSGNYPVLTFIHGGGFYFGNSDENGADYFIDEEVVLVTLNYRVSALGFLSTSDLFLPGNLGLKDQLLALKWVASNIKFFGGDPNQLTLFGESAGAASVSYHILSPASEGLFRNAICQSGTALNAWALIENPRKIANKFAQRVGCPNAEDSAELKKCLKLKSVDEILNATLVGSLDSLIYAPVIEPPSSHAFLTEHPRLLYESGRFAHVPLVMSVLEKEGLLIHAGTIMKDENLIEQANQKWFELAPKYFLYDNDDLNQETKDLISKRIKKFYFNEKPVSLETFENLTNAFSDAYFVYGVRNTALLHAKHAPVYTVALAYEDMPWSQIMNLGYEKPMGMTHADDLALQFSADKYPKFEPDSHAETASKTFVKAWASMAKNGTPSFNPTLKAVWKPVSESEMETRDLKWLILKRRPQRTDEPFSARMRFWDKIASKLKAQTETKRFATDEL